MGEPSARKAWAVPGRQIRKKMKMCQAIICLTQNLHIFTMSLKDHFSCKLVWFLFCFVHLVRIITVPSCLVPETFWVGRLTIRYIFSRLHASRGDLLKSVFEFCPILLNQPPLSLDSKPFCWAVDASLYSRVPRSHFFWNPKPQKASGLENLTMRREPAHALPTLNVGQGIGSLALHHTLKCSS